MVIGNDGYYVPDKLYEDNQVTLYTDFTWDFRQDQPAPDSRPAPVQDIITGRRQVPQPQPQPFLSPSMIQTSIQRVDQDHKRNNREWVAAHRERKRQASEKVLQEIESKMITEVPIRFQSLYLYNINII